MHKPVIIVAPQGAGKSRNANRLLAALGCKRLVDDWDGVTPLQSGDLALTNRALPCSLPGCRVLTLEAALELAPKAP